MVSLTNTCMFVLRKKQICIIDYVLMFNAVWYIILIITNLIYSFNTEQVLEEPLPRRYMILIQVHSYLVRE